MSELVNNNQVTVEEEVQGVRALVPEEPQQNTIVLETSSSTVGPDYWQNIIIELMKRISPIPPEGPSKPNDVADRVAKRNPRMYDGKYDLIELQEWIRGMEKIFVVVEVPKNKKVNIGTFYLTGETLPNWTTTF